MTSMPASSSRCLYASSSFIESTFIARWRANQGASPSNVPWKPSISKNAIATPLLIA